MNARPPPRTGEHDIARLIADEERPLDGAGAAPCCSLTTLTLSERWLTTQTSSCRSAPRRRRVRGQPAPNRDGPGLRADREHLEAVVGRVDGEQQPAAGREREGDGPARSRRGCMPIRQIPPRDSGRAWAACIIARDAGADARNEDCNESRTSSVQLSGQRILIFHVDHHVSNRQAEGSGATPSRGRALDHPNSVGL